MEKTRQIFIDLDDYRFIPESRQVLEVLYKVRSAYPIKVTLMTTPLYSEGNRRDTYPFNPDFSTDWIEYGVHGYEHKRHEFIDNKENCKIKFNKALTLLKDQKIPYKNIWRTPRWETSKEIIEVIEETNQKWIILEHYNRNHHLFFNKRFNNLKFFTYNWSIEKEIDTRLKYVFGHGHCFSNLISRYYCTNDIECGWRNIIKNLDVLDRKYDLEFKFISDLL